MTERDVFESRLHAALVRHVANGPTDFDALAFARTVAAKEPRRRGLAAALAWRGLAFPRRSWALLLLAALFVALVAGTLLVGSLQERKLPAVVPPVAPSIAPAFVCPPGSTPDKPGPVDQERPVIGRGVTSMAFDRRAGRLVALTDGRIGEADTWTFDVCTNTWTPMHPYRMHPNPSFSTSLVYDVDSDVTVALDDTNRMWAYDLGADTWTMKGVAPVDELRFYDPVSGLVVAVGNDGEENTLGFPLWGYEVETDTWTQIPQAKPLTIGPHYEDFAYDASIDRLVAYANAWKDAGDAAEGWIFAAKTWLFDIRTGTWSGTGAATPEYSYGIVGLEPGIAYDEAAERTVMLGEGHSAAYDATADRWETLYAGTPWDEPGACGARPECRWEPHLVYDPVNERLVVYGGTVYLSADQGRVNADDMLAFDTRTREWTLLLAASGGQPAASTAQAFTCPPGSTPDAPGPVDQERPARYTSPAIAFDRHARRIVLLAPSAGAAAETWTFDVCSNEYARLRPAREPVLLKASELVYDGDSDVTIATDGRSTWAYDFGTNTWTQMGVPPAAADPVAPSLAYDPVSGLVLGASGRELWSYDVETDLWTLVSRAPWPGTALLAYDASVDRIVADAGSETWLYDMRTGTWSRGADPTFCAWGMAMVLPDVIIYDEAAKRTVASCGTRAAYDATADRWEFMTDIPGSFPSSMAFDIVNGRLVGIGEIQDGVFAFDLETREQIVLLEPVRGQATP